MENTTGITLSRAANIVLPGAAQQAAESALDLLLEDSRSPETKRAYQADLRGFFAWRGQELDRPAVAALCSLDSGNLSLALNGYKAHLRERSLAEATINRRLAAVRALLKMARRLGANCPDPSGLVTSERVKHYRDTRGPAVSAARQLLAAPDRTTIKGKRDYALLLLLCENALRRGELHRCDVADFDAGEKRLMILGKGRGSQKEPITLSDATVPALIEYLAARGELAPSAPLFANVARFAKEEQRLTGAGIFHIVGTYGRRVLGKPLHPHALRHMAITALLDATGGDVRTAQRLSRHADLRTLQIYDDAREDLQGKATNLLSALLKEEL